MVGGQHVLLSIEEIIEIALKNGLLEEVLEAAFKHKEQFPTASIRECILVGADEWDI